MPHQRLQFGWQREIFRVRQWLTHRIVYPVRGVVIDGKPPRAPTVHHRNPLPSTRVVQRRGVPTARVLNVDRPRRSRNLHIPGNRRRARDTVGSSAGVSCVFVRSGNHPGSARVFIYIRQIPNQHQTHGDIGERLADTADVSAGIAPAVGCQVMRPIRVPFARVGSASAVSRTETARRPVRFCGVNDTQMQLRNPKVVVQNAARHTGNKGIRQMLSVPRHPHNIVG